MGPAFTMHHINTFLVQRIELEHWGKKATKLTHLTRHKDCLKESFKSSFSTGRHPEGETTNPL